MTELSISEFAAACGLSVSALRRYDEMGLLPPARVDERSGYRWYTPEQVRVGVLVRTLRQLDVPLATVLEVLARPEPAEQLALVEQHWADVERSLVRGRAARDHLARVLGGYEELVAEFAVALRPVQELPVLLRRRRGSLTTVHEHVEAAVEVLRARAHREGLAVAGAPVSLYSWPCDSLPDEHERVIEVCLPVHGDGDAVLPAGQLAHVEVAGAASAYPQVLPAYGAVSQWAHEREHRLLEPPMMIHLGPAHVRVGWRVDERRDGGPDGRDGAHAGGPWR